ncbi:G-protein coupled receptor Mth2-like [Vanessa cardui]|uniref:G-protein coupled receptor Mth2-like n=1 Tax=Vanessa cardui TaxID=171605 RepID=UPI001F1355E5|nr:G-protein coupled receptor Mth2-like [Vanessa cardui]
MLQKAILTVLFFLSTIVAIDFENISFSSSASIELGDDDDVETVCSARKCIRKCCPKNEYFSIDTYSCESFDMNLDFSNVSIYEDYDHFQKTSKSLRDIFLLEPGMFYEKINDESFENQTFADVAYVLMDLNISTYMTESGILYYTLPNSYTKWYEVDFFCVDYEVSNTTATVKYWSVLRNVYIPKSNNYFTSALLISSVFLFLVLLVYMIIPELRNLAGLVLMAYVFSLMGAFLSLASLQLGTYMDNKCLDITAVTYFFFLSTFCWMNVMSFDIWWTFRGYAKARPIHRRGEKFKFGVYCIYAWGIPMLMAIGLVEINNADLSDMPWFVTPQIPLQGCFLEGGQKLLYLYVPMLILIICNWMFFLMTAFNIWRLSRGTSVLESAAAGNPAAHRSQRNRLMVYLKLSVIMGINWLLEIVSFKTPELNIWKLTDAYNLLIGISIFLIFVCKKKIYRKLQNRYYGFVSAKPRLSKSNTSSSTLESNLSQDIPLQVSNHPMGPNGRIGTKI